MTATAKQKSGQAFKQKANRYYGKATIAVVLLALAWQSTTTTVPRPTDPQVAKLSDRFESLILDQNEDGPSSSSNNDNYISIESRGYLNWDLETPLWNRFCEKFGSNPHSPYMYTILPLFGKWLPFMPSFLPSPMWRLHHHDAVVLLAKQPPDVEYFSFSTFCLWSLKRRFVFASLGDSVNSQTILVDTTTSINKGLFAHVVVTESSRHTLHSVQELLVESGLSAESIHVAVVPNELIDEDSFAFFEVVLRLFRFRNQPEGDAYVRSKQPVYYVRGKAPQQQHQQGDSALLPKPVYRDRAHVDSVDEHSLQDDFGVYQTTILERVAKIYQKMDSDGNSINIPPLVDHQSNSNTGTNGDNNDHWIQRIPFGPLYIRGLHCIHNFTECMGDSPDAAYMGSNIFGPDTDRIPALTLMNDDELHLVTMLDHRQTQASVYSSVTLLASSDGAILNRDHMNVRGTSFGTLSNVDFHENLPGAAAGDGGIFFSWIFTRDPDHCTALAESVQGCTVIDEREVARNAYFAYCERLYLNPVTGTGPHWDSIVPAQGYILRGMNRPISSPSSSSEVDDEATSLIYKQQNAELFAHLNLPRSNVPLRVFEGEEKLRFLHIVKTGGEAFEWYLGRSPDIVPQIKYSSCRGASMANLTTSYFSIASKPCYALTTTISTILCGLNCECCAPDMHKEGALHGTMIRSPRSHLISLFTHGFNAHHTTWQRMAADKTNYLAEAVLRTSELTCGHSGTSNGNPNWNMALREILKTSLATWLPTAATWDDGVQVISLRNPQSHAMTCSKKENGSLGQHFRVLSQHLPVDSLEPSLEEALESLRRMEWIGVTDLYHPSLCLLHYQANQTLPTEDCDCRHKDHHTKNKTSKPLGHWVEYRNKKKAQTDLPADLLEMIDAHTSVDAKLFGEALRIVLHRLRRVEEITGTHILECIDWQTLKDKTEYVDGLWTGGQDALLLA